MAAEPAGIVLVKMAPAVVTVRTSAVFMRVTMSRFAGRERATRDDDVIRRSRSTRTELVAGPPAAGSVTSSPVAQATYRLSPGRVVGDSPRSGARRAPLGDLLGRKIDGLHDAAAAGRDVHATRGILDEAARLVARRHAEGRHGEAGEVDDVEF